MGVLVMGKQVRSGLRRIIVLQLGIAVLYAALFDGMLRVPGSSGVAGRVGLMLGCTVMQVAGHSLTLVAMSLLGAVALTVLCLLSWAALLSKMLLGSLLRFAQLSVTEAVMDSVVE